MEVWKPVESLGGLYEVSSLGNARSIARVDAKGGVRKLRTLKQGTNADGYKIINTFHRGKSRHFGAHRLIYEAFHGHIPENMEVNHLNGVRDDNRPENLEIASHHENILHSKNVLKTRYDTYGNLRMTDDVYAKIRDLYARGMKQQAIANLVGFSNQTVSNVVRGKHVRKITLPS